jgi:fructoselysine-6-P-deglycase FrlB-like protein
MVRSHRRKPLVAVGSGGSLSAAHFAAHLHRVVQKQVAKAATPLEVFSDPIPNDCTALLLTARGRNSDIIAAFNSLAATEVGDLGVLCLVPDSPLGKLARARVGVRLEELALPSGKDGFLATNSLLAFFVLLYRAYQHGTQWEELPENIDLLRGHNDISFLDSQIKGQARSLVDKEALLVIHGPDTQAAALDLESKFSEGALGSVHVTDLRNFAHGRHHWIAKRGETSGILMLVSDREFALAEQTKRLLPRSANTLILKSAFNGPLASIPILLDVLDFVALTGQIKGIDPGKPGVPEFGRKIYHLRAFGSIIKQPHQDAPSRAIELKTGEPLRAMERTQIEFWKHEYFQFLRKMQGTSFAGIILDYDGTLCNRDVRYAGIREPVVKALQRLLEAHVPIGVATGRGKSVREDFRKKLPRKYWPRILVAYYNGAELGTVEDRSCPDGTEICSDALRPVLSELQAHAELMRLASLTVRKHQITVESQTLQNMDLWELVFSITMPFSSAIFSRDAVC